eukprot:TRINITY_DN19536_c0_g1_i1.p1 TRINITY_DN19536_c0_g1~~TRINITY_DN19536_c0_g1_i1.p1  ORF type:complete len:267 (-),score=87.26 TRINITY_DN19536_c0_g1_i1:20-820(-)
MHTAKKDNEKLHSLKGQMQDMGNAYEDMIRAREEAKKQLEAKFQDVYRKIQTNKEFTIAEGKRVNDTLKAFQSKFEFQLQEMENKFTHSMNEEKDFVRQQFDGVNQEMQRLEKMIIDEREERLRQTDENLRPIRLHLEQLQEAYDTEKATRIEREKEILQKLADEVYKLNEMVDKEKSERIFKTGELKDTFRDEMKMQTKFVENFQIKAMDEFNTMKKEIGEEMENRFEHQDEIIDHISNFIKTFQSTLKVVGKDVQLASAIYSSQ